MSPAANFTVTSMPAATVPSSWVRLLADLGAAQHVLELHDPCLGLALLLARGVVAAVLAQVAFLAGIGDALRDLGSGRPLEVLQLGLETVVRLLGEPDDVLSGGLCHGLCS